MPRQLPIIEDLAIGPLGVTLVDQRNNDAEGLIGRKILVDVLERSLLGSVRPGTTLCKSGTADGDRVLNLWQTTNPRISFQEFIDTADDSIVRDDSDCDPRLPEVTFIVFEGRTNLGLFTLYNIVVERDNRTGITASAMAMPGCRAARGSTVRETWSGIMRWILSRDFVSGGRKVDFIEWRFPTRGTHRWVLSTEEARKQGDGDTDAIGDRIVKDLEEDVDVTRGADNTPERARRRTP